MNLSEYSYQELGFTQKAQALLEVNTMVMKMLDLSNRGLWSEHLITRELIECMINKLETTFDDMGYIKRFSKKYINNSEKKIQKIYDRCMKQCNGLKEKE